MFKLKKLSIFALRKTTNNDFTGNTSILSGFFYFEKA